MMPSQPSQEAPTESKAERRLQSRKFWFVALTAVALVLMGLLSWVDWKFLVDNWIKVLLAYLGVQGATDLVGRYTGRW